MIPILQKSKLRVRDNPFARGLRARKWHNRAQTQLCLVPTHLPITRSTLPRSAKPRAVTGTAWHPEDRHFTGPLSKMKKQWHRETDWLPQSSKAMWDLPPVLRHFIPSATG